GIGTSNPSSMGDRPVPASPWQAAHARRYTSRPEAGAGCAWAADGVASMPHIASAAIVTADTTRPEGASTRRFRVSIRSFTAGPPAEELVGYHPARGETRGRRRAILRPRSNAPRGRA